MTSLAAPHRQPLAIERLGQHGPPPREAVDAFLAEHQVPIVEGDACTFLWRGEADAVGVVHRVVGLPGWLPLDRLEGTDLWAAVVDLPAGSRVEYKLEVVRGDHREQVDDPLNPRVSHNPMGTNSVCLAQGYVEPDWAQPDPEARTGTLEPWVVGSAALARDVHLQVYLPARFRRSARYPVLVVHDGSEYLRFAAAKVVLDNLLHRLDVAEVVVAFIDPGDRLVEYADDERHARFVAEELVPHLERELPLLGQPSGRTLMGSSFGAVAALTTATRFPRTFGSLLLQSASLVFTDIGWDHGGGEVFDPVVRFVNAYRDDPRRVVDRIFLSCGVYEPLIVRNRAMVPTFESTGMQVRFVESRDGHNWEGWRDRLRDGLAWLLPGPQRLYYE